jgi:ERF superfamily
MEITNLVELLEFNKQLSELISARAKEINTPKEDKYESDQTNEIATALSKAQGDFPGIYNNKSNPHFKSSYADIDTIFKAVRSPLAKNGLCITQQTQITGEGMTILTTRIRHSSGQWIETRARLMPPKNDAQSYASALTYMRRYQILSILGAAQSDDDDDGEAAMIEVRDVKAKGVALNTKYYPRDQAGETITKEQLEELEYELAEYPDITEMILEGFRLQSIADMPKNKYMPAITRVREIKMLRNGEKAQQ